MRIAGKNIDLTKLTKVTLIDSKQVLLLKIFLNVHSSKDIFIFKGISILEKIF